MLHSLFFICTMLFALPLRAQAQSSCEAYLVQKLKISNKDISGFVRVSSGREVFVRIQHPLKKSSKDALFLVHGLLDSRRRFDELTEKALSDGRSVVRLDIYGFGKSLINELNRNKGDLGFLKEMPYETNVQDLKDIVIWLDQHHSISSLTAVGHSMGGGLLAALVSHEEMKKYVRRLVLVSPYIYRLEKYYLESHIFNPWAWNPFIPPFLSQILENLFRAGKSAFVDRYLSINDPMIDRVYLNSFLKEEFSNHLDELAEEHKIDEALKEALVVSAIGTVKGLRALNILDLIDQIPLEVRLDQVLLEKDRLVPLDFQTKLSKALKTQRTDSEIFSLNSGHMSLHGLYELLKK